MGVDRIGAYREHPYPGRTPNIDALAAKGMLFRNAWSTPVCCPTRACILTGKYPFRTGIGSVIGSEGGQTGLSTSEMTLPKALKPVYTSFAIGKWHLASPEDHGPDHALKTGFDHHYGSMYNLDHSVELVERGDYYRWEKVTDGKLSICKRYATTENVDDAIRLVGKLKDPWFLYLAYNAPHIPLHVPPDDLHSFQNELKGDRRSKEYRYKAMVEAADRELGRLLKAVPGAIVIVAGDNGTISGAVTSFPDASPSADFDPKRAKTTIYEGGINVPLIVAGPGIPKGESEGLVNLLDLFATVLELAGRPVPKSDSVSLVPYFDGEKKSLRPFVYTELFRPNGPKPYRRHLRAIRDSRYKLITVRRGRRRRVELYDLKADPFERKDLLKGELTADQERVYRKLKARLKELR